MSRHTHILAPACRRHRFNAALRLVLPAFAALADGPAMAQQAAPAAMPEVKVVARADGSYAVESSATSTRFDTLVRDTPQAITIVSKELIADQAMRSMADAIRYVPGVVTAQGEGNRDTAVFRGNSSTSDFYIDGIRDDVQYFRDFYNVESMEALKGANAMIFGRGGSGGVINRVTKQPEWRDIGTAALAFGAYGNRRASIDVGRAIDQDGALRLNAMTEQSGSFRHGVRLDRSGVNPTMAYLVNRATRVVLGYEHFNDERTADRGIPSYQGRPIDTDPSTFFGNADLSTSRASVDAVNVLVEHIAGGISLRNRTRYADYDKFYQNVFAGAVNGAGTSVAISAYSNATGRKNFFNQTDLSFLFGTGTLLHKVVAGIELGRQVTDNLRNTGYFPTAGLNATSITVPVANPRMAAAVSFRQSATDADNHGKATVASMYVQDQIEFSPQWQAVAGLRYDRFAIDFVNHRNGAEIAHADHPVSPRIGLVYKPIVDVTLYGSYGLAYVPRAGEQLSSLTATNQAFDPEQFRNLELGAKWDVNEALGFTAALYQLRRSNVVIADPLDATRSILVDGQQTKGVELGLAGAINSVWRVMGGYAWQDATISRTQSATAQAGARLAQVPTHSLSLWNRYDVTPELGAGLGLVYCSALFASTSNTVVVPGFTRIDAAVYYQVSQKVRLQLNLENVFDRNYYASAHGNDNISPGAPRAIRLGVTGTL